MALTSKSGRRAVLMSSFAEWQRGDLSRSAGESRRYAPVYSLPRELRPLPAASAMGSIEAAPKDGNDRAIVRTCRSAFCALHSHQSEHLKDAFRPDAKGLSHRLPSCMPVLDAAQVMRGAGVALPDITHDTVADFNPDTLVTTATTTVTIKDASRELWKQLVLGANPIRWSADESEFFKLSEPTKIRKGSTRGSWKGLLHEVFEWNWNEDNYASYDNILNIDFAVGAERVRMDYSLSECIATDLLVVRQPGGLDVDGGYYQLDKNKDGSISIEAVKSLRYTKPKIGPAGFVMLMSYMTPSVLALWLDQAVYQGVLEAVEATPRARRQAGVASSDGSPVEVPYEEVLEAVKPPIRGSTNG